MHELATEIIHKNAEEIVNKHDFEVRKKLKERDRICHLYKQNKKCHDLEELNCLFCYCPKYDRSVPEGACKINSPAAKYVEGLNGKILDCSDCTFPHEKENAIKLYENLFR